VIFDLVAVRSAKAAPVQRGQVSEGNAQRGRPWFSNLRAGRVCRFENLADGHAATRAAWVAVTVADLTYRSLPLAYSYPESCFSVR
jgi:hypothetical protein